MGDTAKSNGPVDVLRATRNLLSDPERWTKGASARRYDGSQCSSNSSEAVCFCLGGAVGNVLSADAEAMSFYAEWRKAADVLERVCPRGSVAKFNDHPSTTHADVLAVLDRAIELATQETTDAA